MRAEGELRREGRCQALGWCLCRHTPLWRKGRSSREVPVPLTDPPPPPHRAPHSSLHLQAGKRERLEWDRRRLPAEDTSQLTSVRDRF